jgi:(p)ppGpp synthase/HD superfamily hydrolase
MRQQDIAYELAMEGHAGQFRRDGITPYINHVFDVARIAQMRGGDDNVIATALGHDLLEDTKFSKFDLLNAGLSQAVVDAIIDLTHLHEKEPYEQAILRAKSNPIARQVKIADNLSNLSDEPTDKQILKYAKSLRVLME